MALRALAAMLLVLVPATASAQLLGRASSAARDDDDDDNSSWSSDDDDDDSSWSSNDDDDGSLLGRASSAARDDDDWGGGSSSGGGSYGGSSGSSRPYGGGGSQTWFALRGCPYQDDAAGYGVESTTRDFGDVVGRVALEGGYVLGGAGRVGASARVQLPWIIDLTTRYSFFFEPLDDGGLAAIALGRLGLELRIVQLPALQLRVGAGLRHMQDSLGAIAGADAALGLDLFFGEPIIVTLEGSVGLVGEAALVQLRAQLGVLVDRFEIYAGYDYEGLFNAQHVDLGGPMAGVRTWL